MTTKLRTLATLALTSAIFPAMAQADTLRLLTWGGYAPDEVVDMFEKETGIEVKVTTSNNEDMISKLRATGGSGFDLAQPSQDRIAGAQAEFNIYKPLDLSRINAKQFIPSMLDSTQAITSLNNQTYGVPHIWGTSGLVINTKQASNVSDYADLCNTDYQGKVSYRLKRPTLIAFAFAMGEDPFAAYADQAQYQEVLNKVEAKLIDCKSNVKTYWSGSDALMNLLRTEEVVASMAWDAGGWKLSQENPDIEYIAPSSGALGWIDTFALPRKTKNEAAAYQWINFVMRPEIAAKITESAGNFTASQGSDEYVNQDLKALFQKSFSKVAIDNIKWYPAVPAGLEEMEGMTMDRIKASK
ncbi:extracellular solute-binding protein [Vibrio superstes]|uniref:Putrescine-binding periplasmic protein n=1 Tax=Vibrio superstes NBRC 103154 TaxID=1219062 RepID=A0A511QPH7_9VIBR|nr:extracellular solute-binding protein [Vibrio superstes]GEM79243.1 putrescine-binding periplasmic protein [Vibrio superstes NBRC 103154]